VTTRIKETRESANDGAKRMMRTLMDQNKLTDYKDCMDPRLTDFKDTSYVGQVCYTYYGESVRFFLIK
jgi:hypothetical protein